MPVHLSGRALGTLLWYFSSFSFLFFQSLRVNEEEGQVHVATYFVIFVSFFEKIMKWKCGTDNATLTNSLLIPNKPFMKRICGCVSIFTVFVLFCFFHRIAQNVVLRVTTMYYILLWCYQLLNKYLVYSELMYFCHYANVATIFNFIFSSVVLVIEKQKASKLNF